MFLTNSKFGGAERDRTADLDVANVALSQLSYGPKQRARILIIAASTVKQTAWRPHAVCENYCSATL